MSQPHGNICHYFDKGYCEVLEEDVECMGASDDCQVGEEDDTCKEKRKYRRKKKFNWSNDRQVIKEKK